ncbi:Nramp family divalent metal transporter [Cytophagaceae bacterium ABcell3]|nr:Nramp family divalent metal transporter [Cytophagaceae bacterium ABcell3]
MGESSGNMRLVRKEVKEAPTGIKWVKYLAPGLIWMVSSIGSGTILFTPRIGARYEYELVWMAIAISALIFFVIKEVARFTVVTGKSIIEGFSMLPGPINWGVWFLFLPHLFAAIIMASGLALLAGSTAITTFGGSPVVYAVVLIIACLALVLSGKYKGFEKATSVLGGLLVVIALITAIRVLPGTGALIRGTVPQIPYDFDITFVLPWVGFFLAGAAGLLWFSYWVASKGFGGSLLGEDGIQVLNHEEGLQKSDERLIKFGKWMKVLNAACLLGIVTGALINFAFLVLGTELLAPEGVIPEGVEVAEDLTLLLSGVWGETGRWFLLISVFIALTGSIMSNQDGYGRMFSDTTLLLFGHKLKRKSKTGYGKWVSKKSNIAAVYSTIFSAFIPMMLYFWLEDPVTILSASGIISAIHIPFIVFGTLYINNRFIPVNLRPGRFSVALLWLAGIFFSLLAFQQVVELFGIEF